MSIELTRPIYDMAVSELILQCQVIVSSVRIALQYTVEKQKENADKHSRKNMSRFKKGDRS